jgi:branched-chain amino acid transport system ATP-binding protein
VILEARDIRKRFGGVAALDGVSLGVREGEILGIMGPNGSGKTTLFNILTGLLRPDGGEVLMDGRKVSGLPPHRIARMGIARTFQNLRLFGAMTTTENVLCGAHRREDISPLRALLPSRARAAAAAAERRRAEDLLREVGLGERIGVYASALSYGQTKRLELARALNTEPRVLLLDEPTAGMNDAQAAVLLGLVRRLHRSRGLTLVVIEHNVPALMWLAQRIVVLDSGRVLVDAAPEAAVADPRVIEAYLGRDAVSA